MAKGVKIDPEIRAEAHALLMTGETPNQVAKKLGLNPNSVKNWHRAMNGKGPVVNPVNPENADEFSRLLAEYTRESLKTQIEMVKAFRDPKWLHRQGAEQVAILLGVQADKTIRIFEAVERASDDDAEG